MNETTFQKQVISKLDNVERTMSYIMDYIEDSKLTDDEKQLLQDSYKHEKEKKIISSKELKKKLKI